MLFYADAVCIWATMNACMNLHKKSTCKENMEHPRVIMGDCLWIVNVFHSCCLVNSTICVQCIARISAAMRYGCSCRGSRFLGSPIFIFKNRNKIQFHKFTLSNKKKVTTWCPIEVSLARNLQDGTGACIKSIQRANVRSYFIHKYLCISHVIWWYSLEAIEQLMSQRHP